MSEVAAVFTMSPNRAISKGNELLWNVIGVSKFFKQLTTGNHVLMGRKTYDALPGAIRPLPNRVNFVVSNTWSAEDRMIEGPAVVVIPDIEEAVNYRSATTMLNLYIIGGAEILRDGLCHCSRLYVTHLKKDNEGDTPMPDFESGFTKKVLIGETDDYERWIWERKSCGKCDYAVSTPDNSTYKSLCRKHGQYVHNHCLCGNYQERKY